MQINDDWKVESDEFCVILMQRKFRGEKSKDAGEPYWENQGYYPNCRSALNALLRLEVQGTGLIDFEYVVKKISQVEKTISKLNI